MKVFIYSTLLSLFCTVFIFFIHTSNASNSMINFSTSSQNINHKFISDEYLTTAVDYHKTLPAFARRPFTTNLTELVSKNTFLSIGESFVFVNFFFLLICGSTLFYLSNILLNNIQFSYISVILFYFSYTILFAFFPTIYSYDEPIQYFLIFISLIAVLNKKWILYILSFSLSLITRENGIFLLPSIALFLFTFHFKKEKIRSKNNLKNAFLLILPVAIYIGYLYSFILFTGGEEETKSELLDRLSLFNYNFQDQQFSIETLISLFLAVGFPLYILYWYTKENFLTSSEQKMVKSFLLCLIINSFLILTTARAREARLFALPLVFLWPILGKYLFHEIQIFKSLNLIKRIVKNWIFMSLLFVLIFISLVIEKYIYLPTGWEKNTSYQDEYLFIILIIISIHFVAKTFSNYKISTK